MSRKPSKRARQRGCADLRAYIRALIEQDAAARREQQPEQPTLDELMTMTEEERAHYLQAAAALMEEEYRTNPELTITS